MYTLRLPGIAADSAKKEPPPFIRAMQADVNYQRRWRGLPAYLESPVAALVAQRRADDLATRKYFSHKTPEGTSGYVVELGKAGVTSWNWAGENLARNRGFPDPVRTAMEGLMASPTHRENILAPSDIFTHIGVGYALDDESRNIFVQIFLSGVSNHEHP